MTKLPLHERIKDGFIESLDESMLLDCMRCGFCLPSCPTYLHSNFDESQSPRGRIALMKAVRDGVIHFDETIEEAIDLCLGCRACEPACPAGVQYGELLENTRSVIQREKKLTIKEKVIRNISFNHIFKKPSAMEKTVGLVRFYQRSGLQTVTRKSKLLSVFPKMMQEMEAVLPEIEKKTDYRGKTFESKKKSTKVAFFTGCLMETIFTKTNEATIELLQHLDCEIWIPAEQVCCGALQGHSGDLEKAKNNARKNIDSFLEQEVDYIVNNAGGCGAFLFDYVRLLKDDVNYAKKAEIFSKKIIDISSLLYKLGITNLPLVYKKGEKIVVTYQDSCHLRNVNNVIMEPRELLKAVQNVEFKELEGAEQCCGSAGIYNILHEEMSMNILDDRMEQVKTLKPKKIITTNPGCLLQMQVGIRRAGLEAEMEAIHIVDFLYGCLG